MKEFTVIVELRINADSDVEAANKVADVLYAITDPRKVKMVTSEDEDLFHQLAMGYE